MILSSFCLLDQIIHEENWDSNFIEIHIRWILFWLKSYPKQFAGHLWNTPKKISQTSWISLLWSVAVIYINLLISITCHPDLHSEIGFIFSLYLGQISSGSNKKGFLRCTPGNGPHNSKITISSWRPEKVLWKPAFNFVAEKTATNLWAHFGICPSANKILLLPGKSLNVFMVYVLVQISTVVHSKLKIKPAACC